MGQNCIFKDDIEVWVHKTFLLRSDPLLSWNFSNPTIWRGNMGQKLHFQRYYSGVGTQNVPLKK